MKNDVAGLKSSLTGTGQGGADASEEDIEVDDEEGEEEEEEDREDSEPGITTYVFECVHSLVNTGFFIDHFFGREV